MDEVRAFMILSLAKSPSSESFYVGDQASAYEPLKDILDLNRNS
jgi:hypothetical protein